MKTPNEIADEAIRRMNKKMTDEIFLIIQNDRDLMQEYLRAVESDGLDTVNRTIGKKVKDFYEFENGDEESYTLSKLIKTYTTHFK
jgi:hypothetical protein